MNQKNKDYDFGLALFRFFGIIAVIVFTSLNFFSSQKENKLMRQFISGETSALWSVFSYSQKKDSLHKWLLSENKNYAEYNKILDKEKARRARLINAYEKLLMHSPDSRDVLYNLAILYQEDGATEKANSYRNKAITIDPKLKFD